MNSQVFWMAPRELRILRQCLHYLGGLYHELEGALRCTRQHRDKHVLPTMYFESGSRLGLRVGEETRLEHDQ
jgi:hypothetical protein